MFAEECSGGIILRKKLAEGNKDVMKCYTGPQTWTDRPEVGSYVHSNECLDPTKGRIFLD